MNKSQAHILFIAPPQSYRIAPYLKAAKELDCDLTIASMGEYSLVSPIAEGIHIDFADHEAALARLKEHHQQHPFNAVIGGDDLAVELASRLANELGLAHNSPQASLLTRRKDLARAHLQQAGVAVPAHSLIDLTRPLAIQLEQLHYPCVLKPLAMSMSRGVIRVDNTEQAQQACARIESIIQEALVEEEQQKILAEQYIDGEEIAYEGLLTNGELKTLLFFDKPEPLTGPYFEESYYITPSRQDKDIQQRVYEVVKAACDSYGLVTGPVHAELRVDEDGKVWVLEVAARTIGGECARLVELATEQSLEKLVLSNALSQLHSLPELKGAAGVLMIPTTQAGVLRRVEGVMAAQNVEGIKEVVLSVREGHQLVPLPEGSSYLGFMYGLAETPEQVEQALREAHAKLNVVIAPLFDIEDRRNTT